MTDTAPAPGLLSPLTNFRDLGGIALPEGRVRPGVVWRADDISRIDETGAQRLLDQGLGLILDLRSSEEAEHTGRGPFGALSVDYEHLPMTEGATVPGASLADAVLQMLAADPEGGMGAWYATTAVAQAKTILRGFERIALTEGATVFHCTAGKDRTGIFAASLLLTLGASEADVVTDYARTNDNLDALLARIASGGGAIAQITSDRVPSAVRGAPAGNMRSMFRVLNTEHGGLLQVLTDAGLDRDLTERLRARMVLAG